MARRGSGCPSQKCTVACQPFHCDEYLKTRRSAKERQVLLSFSATLAATMCSLMLSQVCATPTSPSEH